MSAVSLFELVLLLVGAALILSLAAMRLHLPAAAALVVGGMALALIPTLPPFTMDSDLILVLFLPPLLMGSAYFTVWRDFKAQIRPILLLSVGAVVFTTLVVGIVARLMMPSLPWAACFALGAIVSPPDAVAAKAVLQRLSLPERLVTILEGESLVNDASGLVIYKFAVVAALTGSFSATDAAQAFVWLVVGGIGLGLVSGLLWTELVRRLNDPSTIIVSSFLGAWSSYILAERFHASGVLATVACGLVVGIRSHTVLNANVRVQAAAVWSLVTFVMEALVFVLIGLALRGVLHRGGDGEMSQVSDRMPMALAITAAVVLARFAWIGLNLYLPMLYSPQRRATRVPAGVPIVLGWAGMRGVVTLTAALALPLDFPGRDTILFASFVVILFTVLVQGTTLAPLILGLKLTRAGPSEGALMNLNETRIAVTEAGLVSLQSILVAESGEVMHPRLIDMYQRKIRAMSRLRDEGFAAIESERSDHFTAALGALATSRQTLLKLHRERKIHDSVLRTIEGELDLEELRLMRAAEK
jgi:monovalent cation/hydrogen antiporter